MNNSGASSIIFSGSSHPELAKSIAQHAGLPFGQLKISQFPDGEISVSIEESIRGKDVFVVQSTALQPNHYFMELLIIIDALRRASAKSIIAVIPYFGYSRQDRKDKPRVPITAKLIANLLTAAGINHLLTMDLHAPQLQGFFDVPVDDLDGHRLLASKLKARSSDKWAVVAPDMGSVKLARNYALALNCEFVVIDKQRHTASIVQCLNVIGDVAGKDVLLADDMCTTGGTLVSAAKACHEKGARHIYAAVTHGVFVGEAVAALENSPLEWILTTDTVPFTDRLDKSTKIQQCSIAPLFGQAIRCYVTGESISSLLSIT